jgi:hypothetical protein
MRLSGDVILSLLTGFCLLALAMISKYVLNAQLDFVSLYGPAWVFIAYVITRDKAKKARIRTVTAAISQGLT